MPVWANVGLGPANAHVQRLPCSQALQHRSTEYGFEKSRMGRESDHGAAPGYMRGAEQVAPGCQRRRVKGDVSADSCITDLVAVCSEKQHITLPFCTSSRHKSPRAQAATQGADAPVSGTKTHESPEIACLTCADCACAQRHGAVSLRSPANPQSTPVEKIVDCLGSHGRSQH